MPRLQKRLWTTARKLPGNILPVILGLPFLAMGLFEYPKDGLVPHVLLKLALFPIISWVSTIFLGLFGNNFLRQEMSRRLHAERPFDKTEKVFVGFAKPGFVSTIDPHQDVGFLIMHQDRIEFYGSEFQVEVLKDWISNVRFQPNVHTLLGLGRWIAIEGQDQANNFKLLIEPREKRTLIGNLMFSKTLKRMIESWRSNVNKNPNVHA